MTANLTPRQKEILAYIRQKTSEEGTSPTLRQADLGVTHAAVAQIINVLEDKGVVMREGRYGRALHVLDRQAAFPERERVRQVPVVGRIAAGLPMYAQEEWDGTVVVDADLFPGGPLFALRVEGDSMKDAGILDGDFAICEPRQYAENNEIVVALVNGEEATVKRFFLDRKHKFIELRPENPDFSIYIYGLEEVRVQGKVIGIVRGPEGMKRFG